MKVISPVISMSTSIEGVKASLDLSAHVVSSVFINSILHGDTAFS